MEETEEEKKSQRQLEKERIKAILAYNKNEFFRHPPNFDTPPLDFEEETRNDGGWSLIAKTIISK